MQDLMTTIKEANRALDQRIADLKEKPNNPNTKIFETTHDVDEFFKPFFEKQNEEKSFESFKSLIVLDRQYNFIGGGIIKEGGGTITITG